MFDKNGYLDFNAVNKSDCTWNFIIGGRGIGKTFGAILREIKEGRKFLFLRKQQNQADLISRPDFSPVAPVASFLGIEPVYKPLSKNHAGIYVNDELIGMTAALTTFSNLRGFSAEWVQDIIYDEFLGEPHEKKIKNEWSILANVYETVNRNRELAGKDPVRLYALANSTNIANDYFVQLQVVEKLYKIQQKQSDHPYVVYKRDDLQVIYITKSPISDRKKHTALYRLTAGSEYENMALYSQFDVSNYENIRSEPIGHYKPMAAIGELIFYKSKTERKYYISSHRSGSPVQYELSETGIKKFIMTYPYIFEAYYENRVYFENIALAVLFDNYFNL